MGEEATEPWSRAPALCGGRPLLHRPFPKPTPPGGMVQPDERYMQQALDLARRPSFTSPNPRVGAVVVRDGTVVGEGAHRGAGTPHAEAAALAGVDARGATLYVTLEPCTHRGRTPPCTPMLVAAGLARVVVALEDPDPRVSGSGLRALRSAGVDVTTGVLASEAEGLNRAYLHHRRTGRSFVSLKLALTLDGHMTAADGSSQWITGPEARALVHARRLECDAVLVGAGTVLADDPRLTVRDVPAARQPLRVVADAAGRVPATAALFAEPSGGALVATTAACPHDAQIAWKEAGAEVLVLPEAAGGVDLGALVEALGGRGIVEILCEGGARLASSLVKARLADRLDLHYAPLLTGGGVSIGDLGITTMAEALRYSMDDVTRAGDDLIVTLVRSG
ncbi:MAG: bifunctional diaminohydroxyphosphoribosylaminopyrimidine deaminase/5-amino-6-(5-phosphoribosylamino)uracil reductase RibD [Actinomycetota bacterium]